MMYSKYIKQVENILKKESPGLPPQQINAIASYIGTKHKVLGTGTLCQKKLAKLKYDLELENHEILNTLDELFRSTNIFEFKSAGLCFIDAHYKRLDKDQLLKIIIPWAEHVDNWAHSDFLSKFYTRFLESSDRKKLLPVLKKWNKDENPWKRRQSMVALMYYARTRKNHLDFNTVISFVDPHLHAEEYYVQKGLGWTLRECYNVYPDLTFEFMDKNFDKISAVAFTAACEKMPSRQKEYLKRKRKLHRTKR